jgi:hypothetical protein
MNSNKLKFSFNKNSEIKSPSDKGIEDNISNQDTEEEGEIMNNESIL